MGTLAWLGVVVVTNAITLLLVALCAAAGADGAYHEGFTHGREVGRREGYEAAQAGAMEEAA